MNIWATLVARLSTAVGRLAEKRQDDWATKWNAAFHGIISYFMCSIFCLFAERGFQKINTTQLMMMMMICCNSC